MLRRVGPFMVGVAMGAASFPTASWGCTTQQDALQNGPSSACVNRTGGAVIEAWAFGTLSAANQPKSQAACDLSHVCALAVSSSGGGGTGTGVTIETFFESSAQGTLPPNLPFTLSETIDYPHPVISGAHPNSGHGACYPGSGVMQISDGSSILVLDIVGQACQVGHNTTQLVFTGSYVSDTASNGEFANPDAIGTVNISDPSGLAGTGGSIKMSLAGQLLYGSGN